MIEFRYQYGDEKSGGAELDLSWKTLGTSKVWWHRAEKLES